MARLRPGRRFAGGSGEGGGRHPLRGLPGANRIRGFPFRENRAGRRADGNPAARGASVCVKRMEKGRQHLHGPLAA